MKEKFSEKGRDPYDGLRPYSALTHGVGILFALAALAILLHISPGQITRLKRNESVSTHTIDMFCRILDCEVADIMKYIPDQD